MFTRAVNLTEVFWKVENTDGSEICYGPQQYEKIDRDKIELVSLIYKNKPILQVHPKGRTFCWRMKTIGNLNMGTHENNVRMRVHMLMFLGKPGSEFDQRCQVPFHDNHPPQVYFHNQEETMIYYLFENAKIEQRTKFSNISPYRAIHLRPEEFEHLMGVKDESTKPLEGSENVTGED